MPALPAALRSARTPCFRPRWFLSAPRHAGQTERFSDPSAGRAHWAWRGPLAGQVAKEAKAPADNSSPSAVRLQQEAGIPSLKTHFLANK